MFQLFQVDFFRGMYAFKISKTYETINPTNQNESYDKKIENHKIKVCKKEEYYNAQSDAQIPIGVFEQSLRIFESSP